MKKPIILVAPLLAIALPAKAATIAQMRDQRRVLLVAAPSAADRGLAQQRRALATWRQGADDRDVSVVEVVGTYVNGSDDPAGALRHHYDLMCDRFSTVLIGKDGHVALRSATALSAAKLKATIDAMPMRRAGER